MVKTPRSIDGFILRPNNARTSNSKGRAFMDQSATDSYPEVINDLDNINDSDGVNHQLKDSSLGNNDLMADIESSLSDIEIDNPNSTETKSKHKRIHNKKDKKPLNKKKLIKRVVIGLVVILVFVLGYLGIKAAIAGSKVFKGNPLEALTTKTRLAEDSNGRTNILIFGTSGYKMSEDAWDGAMLTDSIMVLSIDQDKHDAYMISLPRDLYVKHTCPTLGTTEGKLNETFYCAYAAKKDEAAGAKSLMSKAGDILGLDVQYYVHADWTALTQAVDAVGGIDVTIESTDSRGIYDSGTNIRYNNGEVAHLNGDKALALSRARNHNAGDYGLSGGNYDREKNQQKILAAVQQKALSVGTLLNPTAVDKLLSSLGDNLVTNFQSSHVQSLIDVVKNLKADSIKQLPFVGRKDGGADLISSYSVGGSYKGEAPVVGPFDYSQIQSYIAQNLSNDPVVKEAAKVDVLNGSGESGLAKTKAEELKEAKYNIVNVANAPAEVSDKVVVYQINNNMTNTAAALKKKYGVEIQQGSLSGYSTASDFVVVFGQASTSSTSE